MQIVACQFTATVYDCIDSDNIVDWSIDDTVIAVRDLPKLRVFKFGYDTARKRLISQSLRCVHYLFDEDFGVAG